MTAFLVFLLAIPVAMLQAFVALEFWCWFAMPLGAPMIVSFWHMLGLVLLARLVRGSNDVDLSHLDETYGKIDKDLRPFVRLTFNAIVVLGLWAVGAVVHGLAF